MEALAIEVFQQASSSAPPRNAECFYLADILFDSMEQFHDGGLPPALAEHATIAKIKGVAHTGGPVAFESIAPAAPQIASADTAPAPSSAPAHSATAPTIAATKPAAPAPVVPAPAAAAPPPAQPASFAGLSRAKKSKMAQEKAAEVAKHIDNGHIQRAKASIVEALQMLQT